MKSVTFDAIGTKWTLDIGRPHSNKEVPLLLDRIRSTIDLFDTTYSRFKKDSLISTMAKQAGEYQLSDEGMAMLRLSKQLYDATDGSFTPLIGSVMEDAGYDRDYSLRSKKLRRPPYWDDVLSLHGETLTVKEPVLLDFGALGKGKLIDIVAGIVTTQHIREFCIDAGGDIRYHHPVETLSVGLEHPEQLTKVIGVANIRNQSIAASAGNRRKWGDFHHLIDPKTMQPARSVIATWVITDSAMLADALATALFFTPASVLMNLFPFSYLVLFPDYTVEKSEDFPAELFYNNLRDKR